MTQTTPTKLTQVPGVEPVVGEKENGHQNDDKNKDGHPDSYWVIAVKILQGKNEDTVKSFDKGLNSAH